jgi:hypothetical protein
LARSLLEIGNTEVTFLRNYPLGFKSASHRSARQRITLVSRRLSSFWLEANAVNHRLSDFLFAAEATLSRLDRCVFEVELDLFGSSARDMTEPGACAAQIAIKTQHS